MTEQHANGPNPFPRILVAIDFTEIAQHLLLLGSRLAQHLNSKLYIAHAIPPDGPADSRNQAAKGLTQLLRATGQAFGPDDLLIGEEPLSNAIEHFILQNRIDLVIAGTHGFPQRYFRSLGSGAEQIFRSATCPVLLIGPQVLQKGSALTAVKNILFATDYRSSRSAASYAIAVAHWFAARLSILHVVEDPGAPLRAPLEHVREIELQRMKYALHSSLRPDMHPSFLVRFGQARPEILLAAKEFASDLVVIGAKSRSEWAQGVPLSTAYHVMAEAPCPVLSVREDTSLDRK